MLQRTSIVDLLNVSAVSFSSIVEIGDATYYQALSRALAVQRQRNLFYGTEGFYESFPIYSEPIPLPPITENVETHFENLKPIIKVNHINITGLSSASLLQIGNCRHLYSEARIKHIRQLEQSVSTPVGDNLIQLNAPSQLDIVTSQSPVSVTGKDTAGADITEADLTNNQSTTINNHG